MDYDNRKRGARLFEGLMREVSVKFFLHFGGNGKSLHGVNRLKLT